MRNSPKVARAPVRQSLTHAKPPKLRLGLQFDDSPQTADLGRAQVRRWVTAALVQSAQLTVRFVGLAEAKRLNRRFRAKNYATNVLTFDYGQAADDAIAVAADIVICPAVVAREALAQGKRFKDHLAHLVIHGTLHAQGWDHDTEAEAQAMEALEIQLLKRFRIASPYE